MQRVSKWKVFAWNEFILLVGRCFQANSRTNSSSSLWWRIHVKNIIYQKITKRPEVCNIEIAFKLWLCARCINPTPHTCEKYQRYDQAEPSRANSLYNNIQLHSKTHSLSSKTNIFSWTTETKPTDNKTKLFFTIYEQQAYAYQASLEYQ